ncbi:aromatic-ring-hydroxylating dioxygenase subunit beta [Nocardia vinacea]|uniref:Aromatic-ring-hydroxylating dioxygenase subunit beta n=1 Tax=Nocardia vinacea TaxID=96468 RepID=A0ABZ1YXP1_9NOCA|nr:aromatic-ring-hydroxylating dioxygenase subunit beta [Nocardia vinacea]
MNDISAAVAPRPETEPANASLVYVVEQFLYRDADLLDQWRLHEWLDYFDPAGQYLIPSTDLPEGDPSTDLFLVQDDRFLLEQRVNSLLTRAAHAEYPHSRTRRMLSNIQVHLRTDGGLDVTANFAVFRMRSGALDTYIGQYRHHLIRHERLGYRFLVRKAVLDLDTLRPHGKVSVIL